MYLMCGPRQLSFFQCGSETPKGRPPLCKAWTNHHNQATLSRSTCLGSTQTSGGRGESVRTPLRKAHTEVALRCPGCLRVHPPPGPQGADLPGAWSWRETPRAPWEMVRSKPRPPGVCWRVAALAGFGPKKGGRALLPSLSRLVTWESEPHSPACPGCQQGPIDEGQGQARPPAQRALQPGFSPGLGTAWSLALQ